MSEKILSTVPGPVHLMHNWGRNPGEEEKVVRGRQGGRPVKEG